MICEEPTDLRGRCGIGPERYEEYRGHFARIHCEKKFAAQRSGLEFEILRQTASDLEQHRFLAVRNQEIKL